ncbi:hypothetical protein SFUMM280S_05268 [Streptomyces fumanus]
MEAWHRSTSAISGSTCASSGTAQLSLRQLADAAGVSNPYLSQIERGLRKPSAEVLQQVAKALRISAETLYVRAGILDADRDRDEVETRAVLLADPTLTERQKQVLLQIYDSFRKENGFGTGPDDAQDGAGDDGAPDGDTSIRGPRPGRRRGDSRIRPGRRAPRPYGGRRRRRPLGSPPVSGGDRPGAGGTR